MPNRRTRTRQLARLAQRRYEERRRRQRQRARLIAGALIIGLAGVGLAGYAFLTRGGSRTAASASPKPSSSASPEAAKVACGGTVPKAADRKKPRFDHAPQMTIDPSKTYTATIETSCGTIVVELLADQAPETVNSFVFLADKHYFDGTQIHRIDTGIDVIQGGDPTGTGKGGPGYTIPDELTGNETYGPGTMAMANAGPNTGGSQFFIVFGKGGHRLDSTPNYTVFGRVVKGLDVAKRIGALPVEDPSAGLDGQHPKKDVYLEKVTVSTSG